MEEHARWNNWMQFLERWGFKALTIDMFRSFSALPVLIAQSIYFLEPFINSSNNATSLAAMLENKDKRNKFLEFIEDK